MRINIHFEDNLAAKIKQIACEKNLSTPDCIRMLVAKALETDHAISRKNLSESLQPIERKVYETLLLSRSLLNQLIEKDACFDEYIKEIKQFAKNFIEKKYNNTNL